jgi:hypothetical protein
MLASDRGVHAGESLRAQEGVRHRGAGYSIYINRERDIYNTRVLPKKQQSNDYCLC